MNAVLQNLDGLAAPHETSEQAAAGVSVLEKLLISAIILCLAFQAVLVFVQEINWDEFYFLSLIYDYHRGELTKALQTFHVYLFGWLPLVGGTEIRQIIVARLVMLGLEMGTLVLIYRLARLFADRRAALLAVLGYISAGFVLLHGASFRADPIAAFLMMGSLVLIATSRFRTQEIAMISLLSALALLVTVKSIFYAPALLGVGVWRILRSPRPALDLARMTASGFGTIAMFGLLYWLHQSALPRADMAGSEAMMGSAAQTTILQTTFIPRLGDIVHGATLAVVQSALLLAAFAMIVIRFWANRDERVTLFALACLATPLLSFLFYRNAFPYFFAFVFPPAMVLVAYAADRLKFSGMIQIALLAVMVVSSALLVTRWIERDQAAQAEVIETVHKIFPQPVAYIDRNSMIASFPKRGTFMSTWGLKDYRTKGEPVFAKILRNEPVPLLILNSPTLEEAVNDLQSAPLRAKLLSEDRNLLAENYIRFWGKIWVAGKQLNIGVVPTDIKIAIPGRYQVGAFEPLTIDGKTINGGEVVNLKRGTYQISSPTSQTVQLRWGKNLYRPTKKPSDRPIYRGF